MAIGLTPPVDRRARDLHRHRRRPVLRHQPASRRPGATADQRAHGRGWHAAVQRRRHRVAGIVDRVGDSGAVTRRFHRSRAEPARFVHHDSRHRARRSSRPRLGRAGNRRQGAHGGPDADRPSAFPARRDRRADARGRDRRVARSVAPRHRSQTALRGWRCRVRGDRDRPDEAHQDCQVAAVPRAECGPVRGTASRDVQTAARHHA